MSFHVLVLYFNFSSNKMVVSVQKIIYIGKPAPVAQLVEHHAGGREFDSRRTNTQALKITE